MSKTSKKTKKRLNQADWERAKVLYATTKLSYRDIAEKFNVNLGTVAKHAKIDNWKKNAEQIHTEINTKIKQNIVDKIVDKSVDECIKIRDAESLALKAVYKQIEILNDNPKAYELNAIIQALSNLKKMINLDSQDNENKVIINCIDGLNLSKI